MNRIVTVAGALTLVFLSIVCKKPLVGSPPATPAAPAGISNGGYNTNYEFTAFTTDPDTDSVAIRFQWGDGATSDWSGWIASGETVAQAHSWPSAGSYQVKAQAKDITGSTSNWSGPLAVTITTNQAPNTPAIPTGPSTVRKDTGCVYTSIATDPDGDGVSYRFSWGNGDTSDWGGWTQSGTPGGAIYAYLRTGAFQVRAQARDANEALSAWSNPLSVSITNPYPPGVPPTPIGRSEGGFGETLSFSATASDPGGDSVSIRFYWGDGDTSTWSSLVPSGDTVRTTHVWRDSGSYQVKAQARDEEVLTSGWSPTTTVEITRRKWRYQAGSVIWSSPAVAADGTIYVGSHDDHLYAVNPTGTLKWRYQTGSNVWSSPAVGADGTVYVGSSDNYLYAINSNGTLNWRYQTGSDVWSSPAVAADATVYVGSCDNYLYAINPTGTFKWRHQTGSRVGSSPAVAADGTIYVGSDDKYLYAVNPTGTLKWRYQTGSSITSTPAVAADGTIYVGSDDDYLYAVNPTGTLKWRYQTGSGISSSPAIASDGTVYVGSMDSCLYAINPTGTLKWRYQTDGYIASSPAVAADGTVYVGSDDDYLYAVNPTGTLKWRYQTGSGIYYCPAVAADGTVYVGSNDNYLYAIQGDSPLADAPWPRFHHDNKNTGRVGGSR